jgi:hypothetical protein
MQGITINARLFEVLPTTNDTCCSQADLQSTSNTTESIENGCCSFTTEKLKIENYTNSVTAPFTAFIAVKPLHIIHLVPAVQSKPEPPLFVHNKHGGEEVIISNCQLLI